VDKIVAYCGLVCSDCDAYIATQANDPVALERVAAQWREEYHAPDITVAGVMCDGCLGVDGRHCGHCYECEIRACGMARGVVNCAYCADYGCERLERFWGFAPNLRALLDGIRAGLPS
jgi:hypothetical protein